MRLRTLELQGFKSFPDKTVLSFKDGITVVVGPNGSGKSNIADAVRWVLGELSARNIRGSKMEDVIFSGTDSRRQSGFAEVSLTIDNTAGDGRLDTEHDTVTVTRRYYRSGESEYMINRKQVRLKDIAELFMNTGVGKSGYSIIGQGRISEIISKKSEDRRNVFEDAAGISKYRSKKNESERRLSDTESNLVRLEDIIGELKSRVGPLEKEAETAKEYLKFYEQKKAADVSIWLLDAGSLKLRCDEAERKFTASALTLEDVEGMITSLENKSDRIEEELREARASADLSDASIKACRDRLYKADSAEKVFGNEIKHIRNQIEANRATVDLRRTSLTENEERIKTLENEDKELGSRQGELSSRMNAAAEAVRASELAESQLEKETVERERISDKKESEINELKLRLSALEGSMDVESGRSSALEEILTESENDAKSYESQIGKIKTEIEDIKKKSDANKAVIAEEEEKLAELTRKCEAARSEAGRISARADSFKARAETLKRMEELLEGYNHSVKSVMSAVSSGKITGICGTVSQIIETTAEYAVAVETALGANIQNIVTEDEGAAKAAIEYLKRTGSGRATFYPITSVKAQSIGVSEKDLAACAGYVGIASELVRFDSRYSGVIGSMLGRTAVFNNIDNAAKAAKSFGYRLRAVTLDGQLVNAGGSFTGGSVKRDSGMLTRSAEIAELTKEEMRLRGEAERIEKEAAEFEKNYADINSSIEGIRSEISLLATMLNALDTRSEVLRSKQDAAMKRCEEVRLDMEALGKSAERGEAEHKALKAALEQAEAELFEAEEIRIETAAKAAKAYDDLEEAKKAYNELVIEKIALDKDMELSLSKISDAKEAAIRLASQLEADEQTGRDLAKRLIDTENSLQLAADQVKACSEELDRLEADKSGIISSNLEREGELSRIREEIKDKTHIRENIFRDHTKLESELARLKEERDRTAEDMWDEYELTYSAAEELGYPPITEEQRTETVKLRDDMKRKIKSLGHVNVNAIEEYAEVKERYEFNDAQYRDLCEARDGLKKVISRLDDEMRERFISAMEDINKRFCSVFRELFGGGGAELILTDPTMPLECGIEINVAPPGKVVKNLSLLSGGEQSFVAIALVFAMLDYNPTPFCIFDEIEAALDEINVVRFAEYMKKYSDKTQFISITHRRGTMEAGEMLYGVTMPDKGVSRILALDVSKYDSFGE